MSGSPIMVQNRKRSHCVMENDETEDSIVQLRKRFEDEFESKGLWLRKQIERGFDLDDSTTSSYSSSCDESETSSSDSSESSTQIVIRQKSKRPRKDSDPILFECVTLSTQPMELPRNTESTSGTASEPSGSKDNCLPESIKRRLAGRSGIECDVSKRLQPWLPTIEKDYTIHKLIGKGSFGTVYAGVRKLDKEPVAIKKLEKSRIHNWGKIDEMLVPFEFQLHKMASGHPGIVTMFDWLETKEHCVFIMQRPDGPVTDLKEYSVRYGPLPEVAARRIFFQIARAITHCHDNGVVHRDIKPSNILVNHETLEAKLIDFGCGAVLKETPYTMRSGTVLYYPPEWFETHRYFGRSLDIWALGVVLYMMVENRRPFVDTQEIISSKVSFRQQQISRHCRNLTRWILTKDPEDRPTINEILRHHWFLE